MRRCCLLWRDRKTTLSRWRAPPAEQWLLLVHARWKRRRRHKTREALSSNACDDCPAAPRQWIHLSLVRRLLTRGEASAVSVTSCKGTGEEAAVTDTQLRRHRSAYAWSASRNDAAFGCASSCCWPCVRGPGIESCCSSEERERVVSAARGFRNRGMRVHSRRKREPRIQLASIGEKRGTRKGEGVGGFYDC